MIEFFLTIKAFLILSFNFFVIFASGVILFIEDTYEVYFLESSACGLFLSFYGFWYNFKVFNPLHVNFCEWFEFQF